jgi:hypothetical protein
VQCLHRCGDGLWATSGALVRALLGRPLGQAWEVFSARAQPVARFLAQPVARFLAQPVARFPAQGFSVICSGCAQPFRAAFPRVLPNLLPKSLPRGRRRRSPG